MGKTSGLFFATALVEIVGCYLPLLWLTGKGGAWLLAPAVISLALFVWLLSLHPTASGRVYASYGWLMAKCRHGPTLPASDLPCAARRSSPGDSGRDSGTRPVNANDDLRRNA